MRTSALLRLALGLLLILASAASHAKLSDKDLDAFKLLVLGPKSNDVKNCLDGSFGILQGLLIASSAPDSKVEELLNRGDMNTSQRELRKRQIALWKTHHSPAKLANAQYEWCLKEKGLPPIALDELGEPCFNATAVPAYVSLLKTGFKTNQTEAMERTSANWGKQLKEDFLQQIVADIYAAPDNEKTTQVFREVFVGCVANGNSR